MRELRPGLWHWTSRHPEWTPDDEWQPDVSSYAIDNGKRLLLIDPLAVPSELEERVGDRETLVVLTSPWHERDTEKLVRSLDLPVYAPKPDSEDDLMEKFGVTREQAAGGSPDLRWLVSDASLDPHWFLPGDRLELGIEAFGGRVSNDTVLWFEDQHAVATGDTLADFGNGLELVPGWLPPGVTREQVAEGLRPLLERGVEHVLPAHGEPTDLAALERALA